MRLLTNLALRVRLFILAWRNRILNAYIAFTITRWRALEKRIDRRIARSDNLCVRYLKIQENLEGTAE